MGRLSFCERNSSSVTHTSICIYLIYTVYAQIYTDSKREKRKEKREKNYSGREIKTTPSETTKEAEASFVFFALADD